MVWGKDFTITGELKDAITGAPLEFRPGENYGWLVVFPGDDTHNGTISRELPVPVSKAIYVDR